MNVTTLCHRLTLYNFRSVKFQFIVDIHQSHISVEHKEHKGPGQHCDTN